MDSEEQRHDSGLSFFIPKTPHFILNISNPTIEQGKFMIPATFVQNYATDLKNSVALQVPGGGGRAWKVGLTKCQGQVWLQCGLSEFMEYYSIDCGHSLVFRYESDHNFSVTIFNNSATEIRYPYESVEFAINDQDDQAAEFPINDQDDDESVEFSGNDTDDESVELSGNDTDDESVEFLGETKSPVACSQHRKLKKRTNSSEGTDASLKDSKCSRKKPRGKFNSTADSEKKADCLHRAHRFAIASNKPFFIVTMCPAYALKGVLHIPKAFALRHLVDKKKGLAILHYFDRTWDTTYRRFPSSHVLGRGWKVFVKDNHLKLDDVCVFELLKGHQISLKVSIFRLDEIRNESEANCSRPEIGPAVHIRSDISGDRQKCQNSNVPESSSRLSRGEKAIADQRAKSRNPFFGTTIKPSDINGKSSFIVPSHFFKKLLNRKLGEVTLMVSDGTTWTLPLLTSGGETSNCGHWEEFARGNNMKVGDIYVFELIDKLRNLFRVVTY